MWWNGRHSTFTRENIIVPPKTSAAKRTRKSLDNDEAVGTSPKSSSEIEALKNEIEALQEQIVGLQNDIVRLAEEANQKIEGCNQTINKQNAFIQKQTAVIKPLSDKITRLEEAAQEAAQNAKSHSTQLSEQARKIQFLEAQLAQSQEANICLTRVLTINASAPPFTPSLGTVDPRLSASFANALAGLAAPKPKTYSL